MADVKSLRTGGARGKQREVGVRVVVRRKLIIPDRLQDTE
jgi:hypothetical protein